MTKRIAPTLIADIGGTNARFAVSDPHNLAIKHIQTYSCGNYPHIFDAIDEYLSETRMHGITQYCFAVAGPVTNDRIDFLNNEWHVSTQELMNRYQLKNALLLNDFLAIAYAVEALGRDDVEKLGLPQLDNLAADGKYCIVGPGSGLGIAGLRRKHGQPFALETEGGHIGFSPIGELQSDLLNCLQEKFGRVSNERLLSGPGLENIFAALCELQNANQPLKTAAEISASQQDPISAQTLQIFCQILGQVTGDSVLSLGAFDGAFIAGGIAPRFPTLLQHGSFRQGFENKGRYSELMQSVPSYLIKHNYPGLLGAAVYAGYLQD